ncbi:MULTISPECIES: Rid family detoxifying hydrolase [Sporomusa]|uniref:Rid family detoxifying hydrolase n=1 Tax=Sporomusa TaxID=2375 RepID=UPI0031580BC9
MRKVLSTTNAPAAIGPYSQGILTERLVFTSGQLPIDVKTGMMPDDIAAQTEVSLKNVAAILEAAGTTLEKAVKMTVFVRDMNDFDKINAVYASFFQGGGAPARSLVQVARLPKDAGIEIECIALL